MTDEATKPAFRNAKFEATGETKEWFGKTLHRIRAVVAIASLGVAAGELGGWIEHETNLATTGTAWVFPNGQVSGKYTTIEGGTIRGGTIWGGTIRGGTIRGGTIEGGTIWGGTIKSSADYGAFIQVGSESGVLTWWRNDDGSISVNRGCFTGTLDEFRTAVATRHGDSEQGQQYQMLIAFIERRSAVVPLEETVA